MNEGGKEEVANERVRETGWEEASIQEGDLVKEGRKQAIERVREIGARRACQVGKKA